MRTILSILAALTVAAPAMAQPYYQPPPPPPGYYPDRPPPPPGYYPERRERFGRHCEAFLPTAYGPRRLFCRIVDPKPVGEECACPGPPAGPGYPPGPFVGGRTVP